MQRKASVRRAVGGQRHGLFAENKVNDAVLDHVATRVKISMASENWEGVRPRCRGETDRIGQDQWSEPAAEAFGDRSRRWRLGRTDWKRYAEDGPAVIVQRAGDRESSFLHKSFAMFLYSRSCSGRITAGGINRPRRLLKV